MLKLTTIFTNNTPYFQEISDLFETVKDNFPDQKIIDIIYNHHGHFFYCTWNNEFIGCLWLDKWDLENRSCYLGGFSKRHNPHTIKGVKLLVQTTFEDYPIDTIYADTDKNNKPAIYCLLKAGFKFVKEIDNKNIYERTK